MKTLLQYLLDNGAPVHPQCCSGISGSCRYPKAMVNVPWRYKSDDATQYACIKDDEVLTCQAVVVDNDNC